MVHAYHTLKNGERQNTTRTHNCQNHVRFTSISFMGEPFFSRKNFSLIFNYICLTHLVWHIATRGKSIQHDPALTNKGHHIQINNGLAYCHHELGETDQDNRFENSNQIHMYSRIVIGMISFPARLSSYFLLLLSYRFTHLFKLHFVIRHTHFYIR